MKIKPASFYFTAKKCWGLKKFVDCERQIFHWFLNIYNNVDNLANVQEARPLLCKLARN